MPLDQLLQFAIERGQRASLPGADEIPLYEVARFREKPNPDLAEHFLNQGGFAWNAGMFVWSIPAIFSELTRHCPVLADFTGPDGNVEWHEIGAGRKGIEW